MNLFNNIKVDVYGQINNDTVHTYTYPARFNPADTVSSEWLRPIEDPRVVRDKLLTPAPKVYSLYSNPNGVYYSLICPNLRDMRNGYMAVTMFVAADSPKLHGAVIIQALEALKRELVDNGNYTNQAVEQALMSAGVPQYTGMPAAIESQPLVSRRSSTTRASRSTRHTMPSISWDLSTHPRALPSRCSTSQSCASGPSTRWRRTAPSTRRAWPTARPSKSCSRATVTSPHNCSLSLDKGPLHKASPSPTE